MKTVFVKLKDPTGSFFDQATGLFIGGKNVVEVEVDHPALERNVSSGRLVKLTEEEVAEYTKKVAPALERNVSSGRLVKLTEEEVAEYTKKVAPAPEAPEENPITLSSAATVETGKTDNPEAPAGELTDKKPEGGASPKGTAEADKAAEAAKALEARKAELDGIVVPDLVKMIQMYEPEFKKTNELKEALIDKLVLLEQEPDGDEGANAGSGE